MQILQPKTAIRKTNTFDSITNFAAQTQWGVAVGCDSEGREGRKSKDQRKEERAGEREAGRQGGREEVLILYENSCRVDRWLRKSAQDGLH